MTIEWKDGVLACAGALTVEDAETLLQALAERPGARADLGACEHVHGACLQVLMAAGVAVTAWPAAPAAASLSAWLRAALHHPQQTK